MVLEYDCSMGFYIGRCLEEGETNLVRYDLVGLRA